MSFAYAPAPSANGARNVRNPTPISKPERRKNTRFPLTGQARYSVAENQAQATLRDISSGGVFLKTDRSLPVGERVRVLIDWPVLFENRCRLRLVIDGKVLRSDRSGTAVKLARYEFRIRPTLIVQRIPA